MTASANEALACLTFFRMAAASVVPAVGAGAHAMERLAFCEALEAAFLASVRARRLGGRYLIGRPRPSKTRTIKETPVAT